MEVSGFFFGGARVEDVRCRFCGRQDGEGHLFWVSTLPQIVHVRELPEFLPLWREIVVDGLAVLAKAVNVLLGLIRWVNLLSGL